MRACAGECVGVGEPQAAAAAVVCVVVSWLVFAGLVPTCCNSSCACLFSDSQAARVACVRGRRVRPWGCLVE